MRTATLALNFSQTLSFAAFPARVFGETRASEPSTLPGLSTSRAFHWCVQPALPCFILPPLTPCQSQTYVLAALYVLGDTAFWGEAGRAAGTQKMADSKEADAPQLIG